MNMFDDLVEYREAMAHLHQGKDYPVVFHEVLYNVMDTQGNKVTVKPGARLRLERFDTRQDAIYFRVNNGDGWSSYQVILTASKAARAFAL